MTLPRPPASAIPPANPDSEQARRSDLAAAVAELADALRRIDGTGLDRDSEGQLARARAIGRAAARLLAPDGGAGRGPVDLAATLTEIEDRWAGLAAVRGGRFSVSRAPEVPHLAELDALALHRLLAVILAPLANGPAEAALALRLDAGALVFAVDLRGGGPLAPAAQDRAAALAAAIGGQLAARTPATGGTAVDLLLPPDAWAPAAPPADDLAGLAIALPDTDSAEARALAALVTDRGGRVAAPAQADRVIVDADAAGGTAALAAARAATRAPVLALTGSLLADHLAALRAAGADAVIARPLAPAAALVAALRDARRGAEPAGAGFDPGRLDQLLDLAGPEVADDLVAQLGTDLGAVATGLETAAPAGNLAEIRAQTHVLISLSGAVGADRLQHLAEALNAAAHDGDAAAIAALWAETAPELAALRAHVADRHAARGRA